MEDGVEQSSFQELLNRLKCAHEAEVHAVRQQVKRLSSSRPGKQGSDEKDGNICLEEKGWLPQSEPTSPASNGCSERVSGFASNAGREVVTSRSASTEINLDEAPPRCTQRPLSNGSGPSADGSALGTSSGATTALLNVSLKLREKWVTHHEAGDNNLLLAAGNAATDDDLDIGKALALPKPKGIQKLIASPGSNWRLVWDLSGAVLIAYDTVAIPFTLAFQPAESVYTTVMDWGTMFFWTTDMILTFFVGYMHNGVTVMSASSIAKRYLMTWFVLDILVIFGDWFNNVGSASSGSGGVSGFGKMLRSLRAIRVLRLLRLLKLRRMLADLQDHISSEYTYLLMSLTKLLFFILFLNHGIACAWYFLGRKGLEGGTQNWIEGNGLKDRNLGFKYSTSMHWTLTQFTPASMEVFPKNTYERTMAVIVLMFALVAFSSFVGSISTSMTALRNMNAETNKQFWMLRRYLKQQTIPRTVSRRILKYLEYIVEKKQGKVQKDAIKILSMLSQQLTEELTFELMRPQIRGYLVFNYMLSISGMEVLVRRLCSFALSSRVIASGDHLFYPAEEANNFYRFLSGRLEYTLSNGVEIDPPVQDMEWISEASLFVGWRHMGKAVALGETELAVWNVGRFIDVCCQSVAAWTPLSAFAELWLDFFQVVEPTDVIRDDVFREDLHQVSFSAATRSSASRRSLSLLAEGEAPGAEPRLLPWSGGGEPEPGRAGARSSWHGLSKADVAAVRQSASSRRGQDAAPAEPEPGGGGGAAAAGPTEVRKSKS